MIYRTCFCSAECYGFGGREHTKEKGVAAVEDFASFGVNGLAGAQDGGVEGLVGYVSEGSEVGCEVVNVVIKESSGG